jgi:methyl-accepting chemotaxis protein
MPLDNINEVLSDSENIGHTGEMILLGEDGLMRSNSRLKMDTHSVQASFANPTIGHFNDPLLMKAFTQGVVDDTHLTLMDYRDQEVLFQSSMIDLHSFKVQLIAKLDRSEAFQPIQVLRDQIILATVLSMLFIIGVSLTLSRTLSAPIVEVAHRLRELAIGRLDQDVFVDPATDEVGTLKLAYNDLLATLRDIVESTKGYSDSLTSMAGNLLTTAQEQQTGTAEQASAAEETKNLLMMLLESSKEVAQVSQVVFDNAEITQQNASMIATHIDELSHHVDGIGEILSLIKDIAAKSDLLALNAALEGTKAGEAGRGFSLVAMQMQKLAEQVMTSAKNIDALTSDITKSTNASVLATEEATKLATETTRSAHQITFAVQQQQEGTQEASIALDEIAQVASEAAVAAHNVVDTSDALLKLSAELSDSTQKFKL